MRDKDGRKHKSKSPRPAHATPRPARASQCLPSHSCGYPFKDVHMCIKARASHAWASIQEMHTYAPKARVSCQKHGYCQCSFVRAPTSDCMPVKVLECHSAHVMARSCLKCEAIGPRAPRSRHASSTNSIHAKTRAMHFRPTTRAHRPMTRAHRPASSTPRLALTRLHPH